MKARLLMLALVAAGCAAAPPPPGSTPAPGGLSRAPYDSPPVAADTIRLTLDIRAASEILAALSRARFDPETAKALEELPAVRAAIRDSNRSADVFGRDLAAAFDEQKRIAVFDFRQIRENQTRYVPAVVNSFFSGIFCEGRAIFDAGRKNIYPRRRVDGDAVYLRGLPKLQEFPGIGRGGIEIQVEGGSA